jgi:ketopantoate reductase
MRMLLVGADPPAAILSMYRDLQQGVPIEADQIIGDFVDRAHAASVKVPLLELIYTNLCVYQYRLAV